MWRFISGIEPPAKKSKLTDSEILEKKREYEKERRKRTFKDSWREGREWLEHNKGENTMQCAVCVKFAFTESEKKSAFVAGSANFKLESVLYHANSQQHRESVVKKKAEETPTEKSVAGRTIQNLNKSVFERISVLFRNAHALIKNRRPFTDFLWLCDLDERKGIDVGTTYRNDKAVATFAHFMAQTERSKFVQFINDAHFFSVISDGCTDTGVREEEIIYLRSCHEGVINTSFLAINSPDRADANGILGVIQTSLESAGIKDWQNRIVGFGSDGASVMMGKKGGVAAKLKEIQPALQAVHCFAHRLELAYKDVVKKAPYYSKMDTLLTGLFKFYSNSALNRSNLRISFEASGDKPCIPTRGGGTRWLPHTEEALDNFWSGYSALKLHLEQLPFQSGATPDAVGKAKGYLAIMKNPGVLLFMLLMTDIISALSRLSLMVQKTDTTVASLKLKLDSTIDILRKYKTRDGPKMREAAAISEASGAVLHNIESFPSTREKLIDDFIRCLETRFADTTSGIIGACKIADFRLWPKSDSSSDFGDGEVGMLTDHFSGVLQNADINPTDAELEWDLLKKTVYTQYPDLSNLEWTSVHRSVPNCTNILALVDLIRSIPAHSADAERGFSEMKLVKSDWRSCLRPEMLSDLLFIMFHTKNVKTYDPTEAIHLWNISGQRVRRPNQKPYGCKSHIDEFDNQEPFLDIDPDFLDRQNVSVEQ